MGRKSHRSLEEVAEVAGLQGGKSRFRIMVEEEPPCVISALLFASTLLDVESKPRAHIYVSARSRMQTREQRLFFRCNQR